MSVDGAERRPPRLMVVTRIWPSAERPGRGIFVANRFRGVPGYTVVMARHQHRHWLISLLSFLRDGLLARGHFDGVEAHVLYPAGLVGYLAARLRRIPVVAYAHGTDVREAPRRGPGYRFLIGWVARHADVIVTNSEDTARHVRALGREPRIIPPGIDLERFRPAPRPAERRVLYLGGNLPRKGYDVALGLADTLVGPGLREVTPDEVARLMREHDVILMPSRDEPFGLVAAEAIAAGRWVVATDVGGLRDIVIDGVNGTLVADGDFAGALARVPDYDPFAIAPTVERHGLPTWQARMAQLWDELLSRPPRRPR